MQVLSGHFSLNNPCYLWSVCRKRQELIPFCKKAVIIMSIMVSRSFPRNCRKCSFFCENIIEHTICHCPSNYELYKTLVVIWFDICDKQYYVDFIKQSPYEQCNSLINAAFNVTENCMFENFKLLKTLLHMFDV